VNTADNTTDNELWAAMCDGQTVVCDTRAEAEEAAHALIERATRKYGRPFCARLEMFDEGEEEWIEVGCVSA
jgi:hypothetical protein